MYKVIITTLAAILICSMGCGNSHDHANGAGMVELNNGEKWEANEATTGGISNMVMIVKSYEGISEMGACSNLKEDLEYEYQSILEKCTMKGEAHEQLHNFLLPLKEQMDELTAADIEQCKQSYSAIAAHLEEYPEFFK